MGTSGRFLSLFNREMGFNLGLRFSLNLRRKRCAGLMSVVLEDLPKALSRPARSSETFLRRGRGRSAPNLGLVTGPKTTSVVSKRPSGDGVSVKEK